MDPKTTYTKSHYESLLKTAQLTAEKPQTLHEWMVESTCKIVDLERRLELLERGC